MKYRTPWPVPTPEVALAKGVLVQAKQDLRRFRDAPDRVGREMYRDAYSWVASNDFTWPYSFINVCEVLGMSPEVLRVELLAEHSARLVLAVTTNGSNAFHLAQKISGQCFRCPGMFRRLPPLQPASSRSLIQPNTQNYENPTKTQKQFRGILAQILSPLRAKSRSVAHLEHDALQLHGRMESNLFKGRLCAVLGLIGLSRSESA